MTIPRRILGTGSAAIEVSALGLGCMGMTGSYGRADKAEAIKTIHRALDLGVSLLDTADMYGPFTNEQLIGEAISDRREEAQVATKFGNTRNPDGTWGAVNGRPDYVHQACDASLQRLGIDHIDLYYQHRVDPDVPIEDTVGAMRELVEAGKVRFLGLSEAGAANIRKAHAVHPITALQSEYSLFARDIEVDILPTLRELGIGLVPYSPLGRGVLTGALDPRLLDETDFRLIRYPRLMGAAQEANLALAGALVRIAGELGCTAAQLALAWVLAQGDDVVPIPGTKRVRYLEENIAALGVRVDSDDLAAIEAAVPAEDVMGDRYADMGTIDR